MYFNDRKPVDLFFLVSIYGLTYYIIAFLKSTMLVALVFIHPLFLTKINSMISGFPLAMSATTHSIMNYGCISIFWTASISTSIPVLRMIL
jgi:hypothetical protein